MSIMTETEAIEMPDRNFSLRGKSYQAGILLLIAYLPEQDWKQTRVFPDVAELKTHLKGIITSLYANYLNALGKTSTFKERKKHFDSLLEKYKALLRQYTTLADPFESLRRAERYSVWQKGREAFETVVGEVVQRETLRTDPDLLSQEYSQVDSETSPCWFQWLFLWEQNFIKAHWPELLTQSIPSSARQVPGMANYSQHALLINGVACGTVNRHATPVPVELFNVLAHASVNAREKVTKELFRLTCLNLASQIRLSLDQQLAKKTDSEKRREVVILTQSLLSPGTMATLKSRYISDTGDDDTQIYEMKEKAVKRFQQAFNDPKRHKAFLEKHGLKLDDQGRFQYKSHAIETMTLLSTNHPYNILRRFGTYSEQTKRNDFNTALLWRSVARYLEEVLLKKESKVGWPENTTVLKALFREELKQLLATLFRYERAVVSASDRKRLIKRLSSLKGNDQLDKNTRRLLDALQAWLSVPPGQGSFDRDDKRHRQSLMAAFEVIVINGIGGTPWVACKSGKDRTGAALAAMDAAEMFYAQRGRFPRYEDAKEDRALYLQFLEALFESGHHQEAASKNAPGARGLVYPFTFLPGDVALDSNHVQRETQLARLNKPEQKKAPKKAGEAFNAHVLRKELDELVDGAMKKTLGASTVLNDWQRNWNFYFIEGCCVKELRKLPPREGEAESFERFNDEADLAGFIKEKLLYKIEDEDLKAAYLEHALYAFHQSGFPHVVEYLFCKLATEVNNAGNGPDISYPQSTRRRINFSPLKNGIEIDMINTFDRKATEIRGGEIEETSPPYGGYYYQGHAVFSIIIGKDRDKHKLSTILKSASVDCADERLKPLLFRERTLFEVLIDFFRLLWEVFRYGNPVKEEVLSARNVLTNHEGKVDGLLGSGTFFRFPDPAEGVLSQQGQEVTVVTLPALRVEAY